MSISTDNDIKKINISTQNMSTDNNDKASKKQIKIDTKTNNDNNNNHL